MKRLLIAALLLLAAPLSVSGCTKYITIPEFRTDTVEVAGKPHTDTLIVTRVDTVHGTRVDTLVRTRVDTVASPPVVYYDTTFVPVPYTVYVTRTDTLFMPGQIVHDTSWVYVQTNPTNPLAGGDPDAGIAYLSVDDGYGIVFWHGHFVGVVRANNSGTWNAYLYSRDQMLMPQIGQFPTLIDAIYALIPIVIEIKP